MSIKNVTYGCDWPECETIIHGKPYIGFLRDFNWTEPYCDFHFCSEHSHKKMSEYTEKIEELKVTMEMRANQALFVKE